MKTAIQMIPFHFAENTKYLNRIIVYFCKKYNNFVFQIIFGALDDNSDESYELIRIYYRVSGCLLSYYIHLFIMIPKIWNSFNCL
jgi:glucan phosphoethanolaminetransferase (alkaline phosphatase superfamily)